MADVMIEFQNTRRLHDTQEHALGYCGRDGIGYWWSYVQFREVIGVGERVRDSVHADLIATDDPGTVSAEAAIGTNRLTDDGKFPANTDLAGCIGAIVGGPGAGQNFTVMRRVDSNGLEVKVLTTATDLSDREDGGWSIALTTDSQYRLFFPGAVRQGDGLTNIDRGVSQVAVTADDLNRYGWVQQTGLGFQKVDASADALVTGENLVATGAGLVKGFSGTTTADEASAGIGRSVLGDIAGTDDVLIWSEINVYNRMQSHRLDHATHVFAKPGQRIT